MNTTTEYDQVLNSVMAGESAAKLLPHLQHLSPSDRERLLQTLDSIHDEIESICREHGNEVSQLLDLAARG